MLALFVFCLFQFALGRPQGQIPVGFTEPHQEQQDAAPVIPIEIWQKYQSHIPKEYYEIGKYDAAVRSSFWQAALRHESGPSFELGQTLVPGWFGFIPTSVHIEHNFTVPLPGGGLGHYISGTFEGPNGIKGSFGSSSSVLNSGGISTSGMSWSTLVQSDQSQDEKDSRNEHYNAEASERAQSAFISQTGGGSGPQTANINQQGPSEGQTAGINQFGSSHGQTATINQGGGQSYGQGYSSSQAAGISQASNFANTGGYNQLAGLQGASQSQQFGLGQSQGQLSSSAPHSQHPTYSQLTGLNSAQLSSTQQGQHATGQIQQTGNIAVNPGYSQLTGINQAAGINQYQFQKPGFIPTSSQSSSSSASSSSSSSMSQTSSYNNTQSTNLSTLGQLQSAGINTHQGTNIHNGLNTASGSNTGPNNYNGPNSGSVAHLYGRPQESVSIIGPSHPETGSAGSILVNV